MCILSLQHYKYKYYLYTLQVCKGSSRYTFIWQHPTKIKNDPTVHIVKSLGHDICLTRGILNKSSARLTSPVHSETWVVPIDLWRKLWCNAWCYHCHYSPVCWTGGGRSGACADCETPGTIHLNDNWQWPAKVLDMQKPDTFTHTLISMIAQQNPTNC